MNNNDYQATEVASKIKSCPIYNTFRIIGKKFTILIIRDMIYQKQRHFSEFLRSVRRINPNILATRLREMERNNLIKREIYPEMPVRIEYHLTEKGKDLLPILEQMSAFSMKHEPDIFVNGKTKSFQEICGRDPASF